MSVSHLTILDNIPYGRAFSNLITFLRISEWIDKIQMNVGAAFIIILVLVYNDLKFSPDIFNLISIFIVYQCFLGCYGYAINAFADRKIDAIVGKYKGVSFFTKSQLFIILIFLSIGSLAIPLLIDDLRIKVLGIAAFFFSAGYSMKPFRFKSRGFIGIVGATLPQRPFMILFFGLLANAVSEIMWILVGWALFIGIIMEIGHQMLDYSNDAASKAQTWIVQTEFSKVKTYSFVSIFFFLLFIFLPVFYFNPEIGSAISLIMLVLSGHSFFYFLDGWKKYKIAVTAVK
ncbi:UbiA prenyltransferase family protein [uncultured archaeon]|nr:UbiA prenyltransferase family protein [uncultured archaeon]